MRATSVGILTADCREMSSHAFVLDHRRREHPTALEATHLRTAHRISQPNRQPPLSQDWYQASARSLADHLKRRRINPYEFRCEMPKRLAPGALRPCSLQKTCLSPPSSRLVQAGQPFPPWSMMPPKRGATHPPFELFMDERRRNCLPRAWVNKALSRSEALGSGRTLVNNRLRADPCAIFFMAEVRRLLVRVYKR